MIRNYNEIRKLVIKLLKFLPLLLIVYFVLLFVWGYTVPWWMRGNLKYRIATYGHTLTRFRQAKRVSNVDIVFLGSSHAYRGFDVRLFEKAGYKVFNLGSGSQTPLQTKVLIDRYLDDMNPKTIVYEVNLVDFSSDGVEGSLDLISNDYINLKTVSMAFEINHLKTYNTLIYGIIYQIFGLNSKCIEPIKKNGDTYINGGYVEKKIKYYKGNYKRIRGDVINPQQLKAFDQIVKKIKDKHIHLILVQAPVTSGYYNSLSHASQFDSLMRIYDNYVDYNEVLKMNDTLDFFDAHHLNQHGVEKFNKVFISQFFKDK